MGGSQTLLYTLSTVHIPFSAPHLTLTGAGSWFLLCNRCLWEVYIMHLRHTRGDLAEKESKTISLWISLPSFLDYYSKVTLIPVD